MEDYWEEDEGARGGKRRKEEGGKPAGRPMEEEWKGLRKTRCGLEPHKMRKADVGKVGRVLISARRSYEEPGGKTWNHLPEGGTGSSQRFTNWGMGPEEGPYDNGRDSDRIL